ncbi:MAG: Vms1/Ankzf1 family peptidyl-tRNA hydrolase [Streptosporangiaceae bacterium]
MKLDFLRPLYDEIGGYVSAYIDTDRVHESVPQTVELHWRAAREKLTAAGASPATVDAVAQVVTDRDLAAPGIAVFGRQGTITMTATLQAPPRRQIARLAALPHLMPLLAQQPPPVPHLRVSATRRGGEVLAIGGTGDWWRNWAASRDWPLHKTSVGGWSQDRYQRSVEETWEENAKALAAEVTSAATAFGARRVIVAGDVHARSLLLARLPKALRESAVVVDEEVPADSQLLASAADQALSDWADQDVRVRFEDWQVRLAHGQAAQGLGAAMTALGDGQVLDMFLADDPSSTATAWIGPAGQELATSAGELRDRQVGDPVTDRADAAIVRALAATNAELHFLPADLVETGNPAACGGLARPLDGVGATLRFTT